MAQKLTMKTNRLLCNFLQTPRQVSYIYWSDITVRNQLKLGKNFCNTSKYFLTRIRGVRSPPEATAIKRILPWYPVNLWSKTGHKNQAWQACLQCWVTFHCCLNKGFAKSCQKAAGGGKLLYKTDRCDRHTFEGWKFVVWYPLGCQHLKLLPSEL